MKKEKTPAQNRRRSALRWTAMALGLVLLLNLVFKTCFLLPIQPVRMQEDNLGVPNHPEVIARYRLPGLHALHLLYLTGDERSTNLVGTCLTPLGWEPAFGVPLDCTEKAPVHVGEWHMGRMKKDARVIAWFGRIDDPDVMSVAVASHSWNREKKQEETMSIVELSEDSCYLTHEGRRYFYKQITKSLNRQYLDSVLLAYGKDGQLLHEIPIKSVTGSSFG